MTAYTQRVNVGAYYTDGRTLWEVVNVSPLGSVDLRSSRSKMERTIGIDAFRRAMWLARAAAAPGDKHGAAPFGTRGTMSPTDATIWWCENCQTKGRVEVASDAGVWEVFQTLGDLHRTAAPKCARKHGTAGVRVVPALPSKGERA
jgi:hypothetical protein